MQANLDQTEAWVIGSASAIKNPDRIIEAEAYTSSLFAANTVVSCAASFEAVPEDAVVAYPVA